MSVRAVNSHTASLFLFHICQNPDSVLWNNVRLTVDIVTQQEH